MAVVASQQRKNTEQYFQEQEQKKSYFISSNMHNGNDMFPKWVKAKRYLHLKCIYFSANMIKRGIEGVSGRERQRWEYIYVERSF